MLSPSSSSVIATKHKAKEHSCTAAMLFHILKKSSKTKVECFSKIHYNPSFQDCKFFVAGVIPSAQVCICVLYYCYQCCCSATNTTTTAAATATTTTAAATTDCKKLGCTVLGWLHWCNVHTKFHENQL